MPGRARLRQNRPPRRRASLPDHHRTRGTGVRCGRHEPALQLSGEPCFPTRAWAPPSWTASPSTPTSSRPAPSPTGCAPARTPAAANEPADPSPRQVLGPEFVKTVGPKHLTTPTPHQHEVWVGARAVERDVTCHVRNGI